MSSTVCERKTRASKTLKGPTIRGNSSRSGKPNASRFVLRLSSRDPAADVRQEVAERDGSCARGTAGAFLGEQHAEVVIERALDHLEDRERQRVGVVAPWGTPPPNGLSGRQ